MLSIILSFLRRLNESRQKEAYIPQDRERAAYHAQRLNSAVELERVRYAQ